MTTVKKKDTLVLVYNADSNVSAMVKDGVTKLIAPGKYQCNLCKVSYGLLHMKREWRQYLASLPFKFLELHRDEFLSKFPKLQLVSLPTILLQTVATTTVLVDANELSRTKDLYELKQLLSSKLKNKESNETYHE